MALLAEQIVAVILQTTAPANTNVIWGKTDTNDPETQQVLDWYIYKGGQWTILDDLMGAIIESVTAPQTPTSRIWKEVTGGGAFVAYRAWSVSLGAWVDIFDGKLDAGGTAVNSLKLNGKDEATLTAAIRAATITTIFDGATLNSIVEMEQAIFENAGNIILLQESVDALTARGSTVFISVNTLLSSTDHRRKVLDISSANPITVTIPTDAVDNFNVGSHVVLERIGTGTVTIVASPGVTLNGVDGDSFDIANQYAGVYLRKRGANAWVIYGDYQ